MAVVQFKGVIPPVSTIIDDNGKLDEIGMARLIDLLIDSKVNGLFFLGTGGEFSQMSIKERKAVAEFAVKHVNGRVPVLIGTGSPSTREAIELTVHSQLIGADGVCVINPYYWQLSEDLLFEYYSEIAKFTDLPVLLYNFPQLTGQDLTPDFVLRLVDGNANIVGIKESVDSTGHIREMILKVKAKHPHFSVLAGFDDHLLNTLSLGGDGSIPASVNYAPQLSVGLYQAFLDGDFERAKELHQKVAYLPLIYKIVTPFVGVVKEAIRLVGLDVSTYVLPPAQRLNEDQIEQLKEILIKAELLPSKVN